MKRKRRLVNRRARVPYKSIGPHTGTGQFWRLMELRPRKKGKGTVYVCIAIGTKRLQDIAGQLNFPFRNF